MYFDNAVVVADPADFIFDVTCEKGYHDDELWSYTPLAEDVGEFELVMAVRNDDNKVIARARTMVCVAKPSTVKKNVSMLALGDSHLQRDATLIRRVASRLHYSIHRLGASMAFATIEARRSKRVGSIVAISTAW